MNKIDEKIIEKKSIDVLILLLCALFHQEATAHMNLGAMYHMNNKYELAEKAYMRALELKPGDPVTRENLAKLRNLMRAPG